MKSYIHPPEFKDVDGLIVPDNVAKAVVDYVKENKVAAGRYSSHTLVGEQEIGYGIIVTDSADEKESKDVYAIFRQNDEEKNKNRIIKNKEIDAGSFGKIKFIQKLNDGPDKGKVYVLKSLTVVDSEFSHQNFVDLYNSSQKIKNEFFKKWRTTKPKERLDQHTISSFVYNPDNFSELKYIMGWIEKDKEQKHPRIALSEFKISEKLHRTKGNLSTRNTQIPQLQKTEFIMEYIPGVTLNALKLKNCTEAKIITLKILESLKEMHDANIIHVDLKRRNIKVYVPKDGNLENFRATIMDVGLAKELRSPNEVIVDKYSGTIDYAAPEIEYGIDDDLCRFSLKSDIYALGVIFNQNLSRYFNSKDLTWWQKRAYKNFINTMLDDDPSNRPTTDEAVNFFAHFEELNWRKFFKYVFPVNFKNVARVLLGALMGACIVLSGGLAGIGIAAIGWGTWLAASFSGMAIGVLINEFYEKHKKLIIGTAIVAAIIIATVMTCGAAGVVPAALIFGKIGAFIFAKSAGTALATTIGAGVFASMVPVVTAGCLAIYEGVKSIFSRGSSNKSHPVITENLKKEVLDDHKDVPTPIPSPENSHVFINENMPKLAVQALISVPHKKEVKQEVGNLKKDSAEVANESVIPSTDRVEKLVVGSPKR